MRRLAAQALGDLASEEVAPLLCNQIIPALVNPQRKSTLPIGLALPRLYLSDAILKWNATPFSH